MDHLAGKLDLLENELRYAWRALDVLSQEYIKMWERMEKLEGLLTEQQTVITQLIDLYTADSSDNAENEFDSNGRDISNFQSFGGSKAPDEAFYKALNMVHQNSYPNPAGPELITLAEKSPKTVKKGPRDVEFIDNFNVMTQNKLNTAREDSEGDLKSMSSSMRSTQSGISDVAEFPVPADTSPTYENLMSAGTLLTPVTSSAPKRKLPQLPPDNRRTRKDGYVGDQRGAVREPADKSQSVTNVFTSSTSATSVQSEVQYDTFPRRKKKKEKKERDNREQQQQKSERTEVSADSPLTVIDGNYSFNISADKTQQKPEKPGAEESQQARPQERRDETRTEVKPPGQENSQSRATANSLFQQIQAREAETSAGLGNKNRKLSLKEKRKLRAEQREMTEFLPKSVEIEEPPPAPVSKRPDHSSESDVSMRSDVSPKRDSDDVEQLLAANGVTVLDQQGTARPRSNGINLMPVTALSAKPNSREFAVSRALGKYRQKKKERESSNSDSQDELELGCDLTRNSAAGIENTLKSLDAKLAEIEESSEAEPRSISVADANKSIPIEKVQSQLTKFEEAGLKPIEVKPPVRAVQSGVMTRRISEDSIDTEDEWYKHEMMRLARLEVEQKSGMMSSVLGELSKKMLDQEGASKEPPDRAEEPPDRRQEKKVQRRSSRKQLLRKSTTSDTTGDNSGDSSLTGSADDDSETQSGEDDVEDEDDVVRGAVAEPASKRPENLMIITPQPARLNISGLPNKPDLLEELTAAAAEDHYPEHLKHGYYGEDGIWYDEHGDTGYWGEDGEWYDYMDEIGYYSDGGEWHEYDYSTGYWDDDGEWQEKETQQNPGKEADHFLWVSEEGTNEFANDQVPSSELTTRMVIGKPASGFTEAYCQQHSDNNTINNNNNSFVTNETYSEPEEETIKPTAAPQQQPSAAMNHVSQIQLKQLQHHQQQLLQQQQKIIEEIEEEAKYVCSC